ncbi:MAG TPA: CBS domain-containing protein, partial [Acidimicrobiales bacterium]|nr:CBS domain-containing protein [Acidimicrobiales bacterium]
RLREHGAFSSLPVGDEASGRIVGLTSLSRLSAVPGDQWETTPVARASAGPADRVVAAPWESLPEVVQRMAARPDHRAMVISGGRLVGIIAPTDVIRAAARARLAGYGPQPR